MGDNYHSNSDRRAHHHHCHNLCCVDQAHNDGNCRADYHGNCSADHKSGFLVLQWKTMP